MRDSIGGLVTLSIPADYLAEIIVKPLFIGAERMV